MLEKKNDCGGHFLKHVFIEDVISRRLKVYKRKMVNSKNHELRAQQIWINSGWNKWMVDNVTESCCSKTCCGYFDV